MADKDFRIRYRFEAVGINALNNALARTNRAVGAGRRGVGGVSTGIAGLSLLVDRIASSFRKASYAAIAFGGAVGIAAHRFNTLEKSQRKIMQLHGGTGTANVFFGGNLTQKDLPFINAGLHRTLQAAGVRRSTVAGPLEQLGIYGVNPFKSGFFKDQNQMAKAFAGMSALFRPDDIQRAFRGLGQGYAQERLQAQEYYQMAEAGFAPYLEKYGITRKSVFAGQVTREQLVSAWSQIFNDFSTSDLAKYQTKNVDSAFARLTNTTDLLAHSIGKLIVDKGGITAIHRLTKYIDDVLLGSNTGGLAKSVGGGIIGVATGLGAVTTSVVGGTILSSAFGNPKNKHGRRRLGAYDYYRGAIGGLVVGGLGAVAGGMIGAHYGGEEGALIGGLAGAVAPGVAGWGMKGLARTGVGRAALGKKGYASVMGSYPSGAFAKGTYHLGKQGVGSLLRALPSLAMAAGAASVPLLAIAGAAAGIASVAAIFKQFDDWMNGRGMGSIDEMRGADGELQQPRDIPVLRTDINVEVIGVKTKKPKVVSQYLSDESLMGAMP